MESKTKYRITLKKVFLHLRLVNKHRFLVFKLCCKAGIPIRGILHDLSKYSPIEFWESVRYYNGEYSPIKNAKKDKGYSEAWLHHKGRNKHHYEYWYDETLPNQTVLMPLKYFKEMVCDSMAAGMIYQGKKWTKEYELTYWNKVKVDVAVMDERIRSLLTRVYTDISIFGIEGVINKKTLDELYYEYTKK